MNIRKFISHFVKIKMAYRTYYDKAFIHQWHPNEIKHIFYRCSTVGPYIIKVFSETVLQLY